MKVLFLKSDEDSWDRSLPVEQVRSSHEDNL